MFKTSAVNNTMDSNWVAFRSYVGRLIRRSPLRWQFSNKVTRMEVIQRVIDSLGAQKYLEIGVSDGTCFCAVKVPEKIGVDPITASAAVSAEMRKSGVRYFASSSDDFFKTIAPQSLTDGVDVVFIDGLHTYAQAYRDCINSLHYLNRGGLILMHDCLPTSESEARVADNYADAERLNNGAAWNGDWVGDVWKAILRLRAHHDDLQTCVLNTDHGIGLVYKIKNRDGLSLPLAQIDSMTYADLAKDPGRLLHVRTPSYLVAVLKNLK